MNNLTPWLIRTSIICVQNIISIGEQKKDCILEALRRQEARPLKRSLNGEIVYCGRCGNIITDLIYFKDVKCCPYCGQRMEKTPIMAMEVQQ